MAAVFPPVSGGSASQASVSNIIISLDATQASLSALQIDIGDPSVGSTNLYDSLKYLYQTADATLASTADDSLIGHILAVDGDVSNYNDNTHSLQALYNALSGSVDAVDRVAGKLQVFEKSITSGATAGTVTVATITTQPCLMESVVLHADAAQTPALVSAAIQGGANGIVTFIDATDAAVANIDVTDEQVAWTGATRLAATKTVIMDLVGTGATAVDLTVTIGYRACADGGYLA